jgi:mono/diheme cytochrome c family protein
MKFAKSRLPFPPRRSAPGKLVNSMKFTYYHFALVLAAVLASAAGCTQAPPPEFRLNMVQAATNEISEPAEQQIADVLGAMFGTPDAPQVLPDMGLDQQKLMLAAGPAWTDANDLTHGLYRRHCVHCHGITGDGRGPTARFLDPYPRDYRKGVFKFKSTYAGAMPTNADLTRVLHNGIPGTSMPSFSLLPKAEVEALVEYVKYLALRGQMETELVRLVSDLEDAPVLDADGKPEMNEDGSPKMAPVPLNPSKNADQAAAVKESLTALVEAWAGASEQVIVPVDDQIPADGRTAEEVAASTLAGRELFFGKKANCFSCHGPTALGDGQQNDYDDWMKDVINLKNMMESQRKTLESLAEAPADETDVQAAERKARINRDEALLAERERVLAETFPERHAIPRNLRQGIYRGGRRRLDVFYRIHAGIKGVPMPGLGATSPGAQGTLKESEIWQLVDYVFSLPYELASGPIQDRPANEGAVTQ